MSLRGRIQAAAWLWAGRTSPLSAHWGRARGTPVDRWFIESFLAAHSGDIRGRVLEVMDDHYTRRFGTAVESSDVLDVDEANPQATIVADLADPRSFPHGQYDCVVVTQTLQFVFDLEAAIESIHGSLHSGGVCRQQRC